MLHRSGHHFLALVPSRARVLPLLSMAQRPITAFLKRSAVEVADDAGLVSSRKAAKQASPSACGYVPFADFEKEVHKWVRLQQPVDLLNKSLTLKAYLNCKALICVGDCSVCDAPALLVTGRHSKCITDPCSYCAGPQRGSSACPRG